jgi:hypothetical protein
MCLPEQISFFLINGEKVNDTNRVPDACNSFLTTSIFKYIRQCTMAKQVRVFFTGQLPTVSRKVHFMWV